MSNSYYRTRLADQLKQASRDYFSAYRGIMERDDRRYRDGLKPGDTMHGHGKRLRFDESRDAARAAYHEMTSSASRAIEDYERRLNESMSEAPSAEALRAIQAAGMVDHVTEAEIQSLDARFGSCFLAARAIQKLAADNDILFQSRRLAEADRDSDAIASIRKSIDRLDPSNIESEAASLDFFGCLFDMSLNALDGD